MKKLKIGCKTCGNPKRLSGSLFCTDCLNKNFSEYIPDISTCEGRDIMSICDEKKDSKYKIKSRAPKNTEKEKKPDASLIPLDLLIEFLVPAYEEGLIKYHRDSWREGFTTTHMVGAHLRHLKDYMKGEDFDQDTWKEFKMKKHHLGAMLFCILCMCDTFKNHPDLDDRRHLISNLNIEEKEK